MDDVQRWAVRCLVPGFEGEVLPGWVRAALDDGLPGVCLYGANVVTAGSLHQVASQVRERWPHALVAADEEGGDVTRVEHLTGSSYPGNLALGVVDDVELTRAVGRAIAVNLREVGITVDLAPSVDVNSDPDDPVIGTRSFGADPELVARHGAAMVTGLQQGGVAAVAKHFPGHGATSVDSHLALPVIDAPLEVFRARELPPFIAAVRAGVMAVMTSHVVFPALDDQPATLSRRLLVDVLRGELGLTGAIVTDALDMAGVRAVHGIGDGAVASVAAGADVVLLGITDTQRSFEEARAAPVAAVREGRLDAERLHDAARAATALVERAAALTRLEWTDDLGEVGVRAARAAVRTSGAVPLSTGELDRGVVVAEVRGQAGIAVGQAAWGLEEHLRRLRVSAGAVQVLEGGATPAEVLATAGRRTVVVAVRDAYRSGWQRAWVTDLLQRSPTAVLVALGMPDDAALAAGSGYWEQPRWVTACSASWISALAAAEALVGPYHEPR